MDISCKRIYEEPEDTDGYRVLIDRLWPRGISKEKAKLNEWLKDVAPSHELRKWFHQEQGDFNKFKESYLLELKEHPEKMVGVDHLLQVSKDEKITLLYGAKDQERNQAVVLREYIEELQG